MFRVYLPMGFEHIVSLAGFDHLLFIIALCAIYAPEQWRRILVMLTGFTVGHSLTLALTALQVIAFSQTVVEWLIPFTILLTGLGNVLLPLPLNIWRPFGVATVFGLVHGCGFAGFFTLMLGDAQSILGPLLAFNLGLEAGQICVAMAFYALWLAINRLRPLPQREWALTISGAAIGLSVKMILDALFQS